MITAKITNRTAEGKGVVVYFDILKDGAVLESGQSVSLDPSMSDDGIKARVREILKPYKDAEKAVPASDPLIGKEIS